MKPGKSATAVMETIRDLEKQLAGQRRLLEPEDGVGRRENLHVLEVGVGDVDCVLGVEAVREVVPMVWTQPLSGAPEWVVGTFVFENEVVPLLDLRWRFFGSEVKGRPEDRIIILDQPRRLGLAVDSAGRVFGLDASRLQTADPEIPYAPFLIGTVPRDDGSVFHLVSPERLARDLDD